MATETHMIHPFRNGTQKWKQMEATVTDDAVNITLRDTDGTVWLHLFHNEDALNFSLKLIAKLTDAAADYMEKEKKKGGEMNAQ